MTSSPQFYGATTVTPRFLPAPLIAARASVFDPLNCQDINMTARRVLFGILTFVSLKNLSKAIFPRRDTLRAESLINSDPTLYRGLSMLEQLGYIERQQIRKSYNGKFHLSPITLTDKALVLIGLKQTYPQRPSINVRVGYVYKELTNKLQSLKNTTGADSAKKISTIKNGLPEDLVGLLDLGVQKSAIYWLMKQASSRGKRLSHVYAVVAHNVASLCGREVVAYLRSLIVKDIDFGFINNEQKQRENNETKNSALKEKLKSMGQRFNGYAVKNSKGIQLGIFESHNDGSHFIRSSKGAHPVDIQFVEALDEGKIHFASVDNGF